MDESPSKRRKTSPITSIATSTQNTLKRLLNRDRRLSTPIRPSFMSPTKSSLARFNPNLLLPSVSAENKLLWPNSSQIYGSGDGYPIGSNIGRKIVNGSPTAAQKNADLEPENLATCIRGSMKVATAQQFGPIIVSQDEVSTETKDISPVNPDSLFSKQDANLMSQELRASPPVGSEAEGRIASVVRDDQPEQIVEERFAESLDQTGNDNVQIPSQLNEQEPQLPYTPTKNQIDKAEPRLPSTPIQLGLEPPPSPPKGLLLSGSIRRSKRRWQSEAKSSPLKSKVLQSVECNEETYISKLGPRIPVVIMQTSIATELKSRKHRIKSSSTSKRSILGTDRFSEPFSLSQRLALFLPFSNPPAPRQKPSSPSRHAVLDGTTNSIPFNPLQVTSVEVLDTILGLDGQNVQHHDITLTSPQHLLVAKIRLDWDTASNRILELTVSNLSPWANSELGPWLKSESLSLNKAAIERTIGRYWEISEIRAQCWHQCEEQIGSKLSNSDPTPTTNEQATEAAQPPSNPPESKSSSASLAPNKPITETPPPSPSSQPLAPLPLHHHLLQHLGRQSMLFSRPPVSLLITWQITITPTGEVHSSVAAHAAFPPRWVQSTGGEALGKVGEAFEMLVAQRGVFESVKAICGVVLGG